tara:strand:+ start:132 stop:293 length:162 start_codon:yes stop_codon:yes gene_type:complete
MDWIKNRLKERSTWNGLIVGVPAVLVLFGIVPLMKVVLWGALAWGVYNLWKSE